MWLLHIIFGKNSFDDRYLWSLIDAIVEKVKQARKGRRIGNLGGKSIFC
jgi:hypothetical protein